MSAITTTTSVAPVDEFVAHVLRRAHREARAIPSEARGVLRVANCFADELAASDPGFDRVRFIRHVTDRLS